MSHDSQLFAGFGCVVLIRDNRYFVRYDGGDLTSLIVENEITDAEVKKIAQSEFDAYEVLLAAEKRTTPVRVS